MKSQDLIKKDEKYIGKCTRASYFPIVVKKASGIYVEDIEGKKYIDFISSACVMNTGYNHKRIVESVKEQMDNYIHFANDYFYTKPQIELAEKLVEIVPGNYKKKVIFGFSGSDAIDTSIKLARSFTGRSKIISFIGAYHGSTYGAISVSAIDLNMKRKIGPLIPDIHHVSYPVMKNEKISEKEFSIREFNKFKEHFQYYIPKEEVACIIFEPIAGDLGLIKPPVEYVRMLREFCTQNKILFIVDEIQQGFGRTGKWFSIEHFDVVPDIVVMGKAMGSGFPISAVVSSEEIIESIKMPGQLFTLQGNAIAATSALETIKIIEDENLLENAVVVGDYIRNRFKNIKEKTGLIKEVRGTGLTIGVELNAGNDISPTNIAKKICYTSFKKGLIVIYLGGNTLRIQPPLVITLDETKKAMDIIEEVFNDYICGKISDDILDEIDGW